MKIFDTSPLIGIFTDLECPEIIDKISELGHDIIVPSNVVEEELRDENVRRQVKQMARENRIKISSMNSMEEIAEIKKKAPRLGVGESDVILTYNKMSGNGEPIHCILDDSKARSNAKIWGISHTGLLGLILLMVERRIITKEDGRNMVERLRRSPFRIPKDFTV